MRPPMRLALLLCLPLACRAGHIEDRAVSADGATETAADAGRLIAFARACPNYEPPKEVTTRVQRDHLRQRQ
jgi:hypothetical protein